MNASLVVLQPPPVYTVVLAPGFVLQWSRVDPATLAFELVADSVAWIGVGFSDDGFMQGKVLTSNAVLGFPGVGRSAPGGQGCFVLGSTRRPRRRTRRRRGSTP